VLAERPTHQDLVRLAFDEPRRAAADQPSVCIYLLEALALLHEIVAAAGLYPTRPVATGSLWQQARDTVLLWFE